MLWKKLIEVGARLNDAGGDHRSTVPDGSPRTACRSTASPDQAAIYAAAFQEPYPDPAAGDGAHLNGGPGGLMDTGTIRYWDATAGTLTGEFVYPFLDDPAQISQGTIPGSWDPPFTATENSTRLRDLAASAMGSATSKSVPVTIDTIQYYNRIAAPDGGVANWTYRAAGGLPCSIRPPTVSSSSTTRDVQLHPLRGVPGLHDLAGRADAEVEVR